MRRPPQGTEYTFPTFTGTDGERVKVTISSNRGEATLNRVSIDRGNDTTSLGIDSEGKAIVRKTVDNITKEFKLIHEGNISDFSTGEGGVSVDTSKFLLAAKNLEDIQDKDKALSNLNGASLKLVNEINSTISTKVNKAEFDSLQLKVTDVQLTIDSINTTLTSKAHVDHRHEISDIDGLQEALDNIPSGGSVEGALLSDNNLSDVKDKVAALKNLNGFAATGGTISGNIEVKNNANNKKPARMSFINDSSYTFSINFLDDALGTKLGSIGGGYNNNDFWIRGYGASQQARVQLTDTGKVNLHTIDEIPVNLVNTGGRSYAGSISNTEWALLDILHILRLSIGSVISFTSNTDYPIMKSITASVIMADNTNISLLSGSWGCYFKQDNGNGTFNYNFIRIW